MLLDDYTNHDRVNLLPYDGEVTYIAQIFPSEQADLYMKTLTSGIDWQHDENIIFGRKITTKRKVAWYGDRPYSYTYSNVSKYALPWTQDLMEIKDTIEKVSGETFNSCLLNLYHHGREGMGYHSDNEPELKKNGTIASLSLGADRKFSFKHNQSKERVDILLESGSLLLMKGETQTYWKHRLPVSTKISDPRINLTFRTIGS